MYVRQPLFEVFLSDSDVQWYKMVKKVFFSAGANDIFIFHIQQHLQELAKRNLDLDIYT